jgi:flagellar biosynthesis/type III secretory pathway protein FliH
MSTELLDESPLYRQWVERATAEGMAKGVAEGMAKGLAEGKAEGLAEGLAEGKAEGKAEGLVEGTEAALSGRFGPLDQAMRDALKYADEATLLGILSQIATITLPEVHQRLGLPE